MPFDFEGIPIESRSDEKRGDIYGIGAITITNYTDKYLELFKNIDWNKYPLLETICFGTTKYVDYLPKQVKNLRFISCPSELKYVPNHIESLYVTITDMEPFPEFFDFLPIGLQKLEVVFFFNNSSYIDTLSFLNLPHTIKKVSFFLCDRTRHDIEYREKIREKKEKIFGDSIHTIEEIYIDSKKI